jgi:hypothetical protein
MRSSDQVRYQLFLPKAVSDQLAAAPGASNSLAEEDEGARAIGRDRFAAFMQRVGQALVCGRRTLQPGEER